MASEIKIENVVEHEDGSTTVTYECDEETKIALMNEGFISLLEKAVSKHHPKEKSDE
jgi:hypothetical protein